MVDHVSTISLSGTSSINVIDGREIYSDMQMTVHGMQLTIWVIVLDLIVACVSVVLGVDAIGWHYNK